MPRKLKIIRRKPKMVKRYRKNARRGMSIPKPLVFKFKRDIEQILLLNGSSPPEGWTYDSTSRRIYRQLGWSLGSMGEITDFQNLFKQYRLKGARMKLFFSNTQSDSQASNSYSNSQLMVRMAPNQSGVAEVLDSSYWQQIQAKKYKLALNGGRPIDIYMPLKQANIITSSTGTANTMVSPKFINTIQDNVVHYGINMSFERVDGQDFSGNHNNYQYASIVTGKPLY